MGDLKVEKVWKFLTFQLVYLVIFNACSELVAIFKSYRIVSNGEMYSCFQFRALKESHKKEKWVQMALRRKADLQHTAFPKKYPRKWEDWCKQVRVVFLRIGNN